MRAAVAIIGAEGLDAFTMPRLAEEFGIRVPSLYHHFRDRDDVLLAVVRYVAGTAVATSAVVPGPDWPDFFVTLAVNFRRSFLLHTNTAPLLLRYRPRDLLPGGYEAAATFLKRSEVPVALHIRILDGMETLLIGATLCEVINPAFEADTSFHGCDVEPGSALAGALQACNLSADAMFEGKVRAFLSGVAQTYAVGLTASRD
ncbi:helix-turn-helix domain containing protein [Mycolicibacterium septicum]|uniref:TetR/AcrR family transcriptional regulator n=1 Tax=Mycolicibacterium septicum TaxID=98668 RepID=UPI0023E25514|nr:TetR/AcrR family transcriptional regulator [Mycolicibacterium septicum]MDF3339464.1 helix-turn-helix domain containing protein [Mycolicibacterium septicum]